MKKTTRTSLFFMFLALFLFAAPIIIAYSRGYRIDWQNKIVLNTGALVVEPRPAPIDLLIDGEFQKRSSFLFQNIYVDALLAKTYLVQIRKEGYFSWEKRLAIAPHLVTEVKNVMLFPENSATTSISSNIHLVSRSPSEKYAIFFSSTTTDANLYDFEAKTERQILRGDETLLGYNIESVEWNNNSTRIFFYFKNAKGLSKWIATDIRNPDITTIDIGAEISANTAFRQYEIEIFKPEINSISWQPNNQSSILFIASDILSPEPQQLHILGSYDMDSKVLSNPIAYDVRDYKVFGDNVFYISSKLQTLNRVNINGRSIDQLTFSPFLQADNTSNVEFISDRILLAGAQGDKKALIYNSQTQSFDVIANQITKALISSDAKRLLLQSTNSISVYWLEDVYIQPFRNARDIEQIIKIPDGVITDSIWFTKDNEHIIYSNGASVNVIELDGRDKRNTHTLYHKPADNLIYMNSKDTLHFRSEGNFIEMSLR